MSSASVGKHAIGDVDSVNFSWLTSFDQQLCKSAIAASDINPSASPLRRQPVEKYLPDLATPLAHHQLIGPAIVEFGRDSHHDSSLIH